VPLSIFISGERSNFIKSLIIFLLIIFLINESKLLIKKYKFVLLILFALFMSTFLSHNIYSKQTEFIKRVINVEKPKKFMDRFENIKYFAHYDVALKIFFDNPFFGIGNKNFRYECHNEKYFDSKMKFTNARCNTHPHQVHFEILSEHGIVGYLFLLSIFFIFIKKKINHANLSKNIFSYSVLMYLIIFFTPLIPSGAFFSTYSGTLFWIIFSIANLDKNKISL
jgi:O-antigen ligase